MKLVWFAKWFVVVWSAVCLAGLGFGAVGWWFDTGSSISSSEWARFDAATVWWCQVWFFPTFGMIAAEFLFRDSTPMLAKGFHLPKLGGRARPRST